MSNSCGPNDHVRVVFWVTHLQVSTFCPIRHCLSSNPVTKYAVTSALLVPVTASSLSIEWSCTDQSTLWPARYCLPSVHLWVCRPSDHLHEAQPCIRHTISECKQSNSSKRNTKTFGCYKVVIHLAGMSLNFSFLLTNCRTYTRNRQIITQQVCFHIHTHSLDDVFTE